MLHAKTKEFEQALQNQVVAHKQTFFLEALELFTENSIKYELNIGILTDEVLLATQGVIHSRFIASGQTETSSKLAAETISTRSH